MKQGLKQRFSTPKPDDRFVVDMIRHLAQKFNAPQCAKLKLKVAHCGTPDGWMEVCPLVKPGLDRDRLSTEYREAPSFEEPENWLKVNGLLVQLVVLDNSTGEIDSVDENQRKQLMIQHGFRTELASALSPFDAVIFVNDSNIKKAFEAGQPFPLHIVLTHECINLIERRTNRTIIKDFDANHRYFDDPSADTLGEFIERIGWKEFEHRYLKGGPI